MADDKIILHIDFDEGDIRKGFKQIEFKAAGTGKRAGKKFGKNFKEGTSSSLAGVAKKITGIAAALGGAFAVKSIITAAATVEKLSTQFTTLLGSAEAARLQMQKLSAFSASTPFQLEGIADASRQLLAFGFTQEESISKLQGIGDAAAASGSGIKELATIFGQVSAAGKLTGERLLQFQERAIPIGASLAKTMGVAESSIKDMVSKGKISFKDFEKAFMALSKEGGLFAGGMQKLSLTTSGLFSTLKDNIFLTFAKIGTILEPITKQVLKILIKFVEDFRKTMNPKAMIAGLIAFGRGLNTFVVAPLELAFNLVKIAFNGIKTAMQAVTVGLLESVSFINSLLGKVGIKTGFDENLKGMTDSAHDVLNDFADETKQSFDKALNFDIATKSDELLTELDAFLVQAATLKEGAGNLAPKLLPTTEELQEQSTGILDFFSGLTIGFDNSAKTMAATAKNIAGVMKNVLAKGIGAGVQSIVNNIMAGENAFANFGKFVIGVMGDMAIQMGQVLIGAGLGVEALKALGGAAAVAAGIGLVAIGTILKAKAGGGESSTSGGGLASGGGGGVLTPESGEVIEQQEEEGRQPDTQIQVVVQGDILDSDESGSRIIQLINDSFDKEGTVITQGAVV